MKLKLKEWNKLYCENLDKQIMDAKMELDRWGLKGKENHLSEVESFARRECMVNVRRLLMFVDCHI